MKPATEAPRSDEAGDAAIEWFVRLRARLSTAEDKAEFAQWLAADAENTAAFEEVLRMYGHLAGMSPSCRRRSRQAHRDRGKQAAAATLAATLAIFLSFDDIAMRLGADHYADVGERKLVTLEDGSRVQLDSKSAIALRYGAAERRVRLLDGEAWFEVAADATRPFVVEAGDGSVTALGTAFDVALLSSGARVTVNEHRVLVASGGSSVIVEEGRQSVYERHSAARAPENVDVDAATAWRRGKLIVTKQLLRDVLSAIGRYHRGFVYCVDPSICARRVSGVFGVDDATRSLNEIEASLGLRAIHLTRYITLLY
jgi:transmembrane sensor